MPITVNYDPVGALGELAFGAGLSAYKQNLQERDERARLQAQQIAAQMVQQDRSLAAQEQSQQRNLAAQVRENDAQRAFTSQRDQFNQSGDLDRIQLQNDLQKRREEANATRHMQDVKDLNTWQYDAEQKRKLAEFDKWEETIRNDKNLSQQQSLQALAKLDAMRAGIDPRIAPLPKSDESIDSILKQKVGIANGHLWTIGPDGTPQHVAPAPVQKDVIDPAHYHKMRLDTIKALTREEHDANGIPVKVQPTEAEVQAAMQQSLQGYYSIVGKQMPDGVGRTTDPTLAHLAPEIATQVTGVVRQLLSELRTATGNKREKILQQLKEIKQQLGHSN